MEKRRGVNSKQEESSEGLTWPDIDFNSLKPWCSVWTHREHIETQLNGLYRGSAVSFPLRWVLTSPNKPFPTPQASRLSATFHDRWALNLNRGQTTWTHFKKGVMLSQEKPPWVENVEPLPMKKGGEGAGRPQRPAVLLLLKKVARTCCKFTVNGEAFTRGPSGKCIKWNGRRGERRSWGNRESRPDFRRLSGTIGTSGSWGKLFFSSSFAPPSFKESERMVFCKRSSSISFGDRGVDCNLQASPSSPGCSFLSSSQTRCCFSPDRDAIETAKKQEILLAATPRHTHNCSHEFSLWQVCFVLLETFIFFLSFLELGSFDGLVKTRASKGASIGGQV